MTKEDKEQLLKDLCARLPYHPIVYVDENLPRLKLGVATRVWEYIAVDKPCKPYLRPMSSMTEEEISDLQKINSQFCFGFDNFACVSAADDGFCSVEEMDKILDYLNSKHFDFRGLIEKGLALEAPEGMYNLNK